MATGTTYRGRASIWSPYEAASAASLTLTGTGTGCGLRVMATCGFRDIRGATCWVPEVRCVELLQQFRMGAGRRFRRLLAMVGIGFLWWPKVRRFASRLQSDSASDLAASPRWRQADCDDRSQPQPGDWQGSSASGAEQEHSGDNRRQYCRAASSVAIAAGLCACSFNAG